MMQSVGWLLRSRLLQLPVRGLGATLIYKSPAPGITRSPALFLHQSPVRTLSGGPGPDASGWYSNLADSAPVHLCEHFLVSVQQMNGCPWWLNIAMATLSVRTLITLPLAAYQLVIISKVTYEGWFWGFCCCLLFLFHLSFQPVEADVVSHWAWLCWRFLPPLLL